MKKFFKAISIIFAAALISQSLVWLASMAEDSVPEAKASAKDEQIAVKEDREEKFKFGRYYDIEPYYGTWKITQFIPMKNVPSRSFSSIYNNLFYDLTPLQNKTFMVTEEGIECEGVLYRFMGHTLTCPWSIKSISNSIGWYAPSGISLSGNAMNHSVAGYLVLEVQDQEEKSDEPIVITTCQHDPTVTITIREMEMFHLQGLNSMYIDDGMAMYLAERVIE